MYFASLQATKDGHYSSLEDIPVDLVFSRAFEDLRLRTTGTMESNGIRKRCEPSPVPTLYVGRAEDLLGLVPLFPCFLDDNTTSTILLTYSARQKQSFEFGCDGGPRPES